MSKLQVSEEETTFSGDPFDYENFEAYLDALSGDTGLPTQERYDILETAAETAEKELAETPDIEAWLRQEGRLSELSEVWSLDFSPDSPSTGLMSEYNNWAAPRQEAVNALNNIEGTPDDLIAEAMDGIVGNLALSLGAIAVETAEINLSMLQQLESVTNLTDEQLAQLDEQKQITLDLKDVSLALETRRLEWLTDPSSNLVDSEGNPIAPEAAIEDIKESRLRIGASSAVNVEEWLAGGPSKVETEYGETISGVNAYIKQLLTGEEALPPALRQQKDEEFLVMKETLAREGHYIMGDADNPVGISSAAQSAVDKFSTKYLIVGEQAKQYAITTALGGVTAGTQLLTSLEDRRTQTEIALAFGETPEGLSMPDLTGYYAGLTGQASQILTGAQGTGTSGAIAGAQTTLTPSPGQTQQDWLDRISLTGEWQTRAAEAGRADTYEPNPWAPVIEGVSGVASALGFNWLFGGEES